MAVDAPLVPGAVAGIALAGHGIVVIAAADGSAGAS
jgi:hypothetical protein